MNTLTFGSLFSGIGGIDLGLERAGMVCKWQIEINPFCQKILAKHWPEVPRFGDIREITGTELQSVDVIAGGFPCQPVSLNGKQKAQSDERWLWPEFERIIRVLRPRYVLVENVTGLLVRGFGDVLGDLAALGYDAEWTVLSACAMGAPHTRERVFVVANSDRWGRDGREEHERQQAPRRSWFAPDPTEAREPNHWAAEPAVARVVDRIAGRLDFGTAIGNAVVPQVAELVGRRIMGVA